MAEVGFNETLGRGHKSRVNPIPTPVDLTAGESQHPCPKASRHEEFSFTHERLSLLGLFGPSTDWVRPTHTGERNLLIHSLMFLENDLLEYS